MMKREFTVAIAGSLCAGILIVGCAKIPLQEMNDAQAAYESAIAAHAPLFAPEKFKAAQELTNTALIDINAQKAKSVFARYYDKDQKLLAAAIAAFDESKNVSAENKVRVRQEATELLDKTIVTIKESDRIARVLIRKRYRMAVPLRAELKAAAASLPADLGTITDDSLLVTQDAIKNVLVNVESVKASLIQLATSKSSLKRRYIKPSSKRKRKR